MNRSRHAFTLTELVVSMLVFSMVSVGLFSFASASLRLVGRNMATNHSHESMRISGQTLLNDLHDSASAFRLIDFDGTNYADSSPTVSADQDAYTKQYASSRANGVRFRAKAGGPYQLTADVTSTSTTLTFNFSVGGKLPYREVAFTVYNNELRYHSEYNGTSKSKYTVVRDKVTSPKPFSLLYPTSSSTTTDGLNLRLSLEYYDTNYSARKFTAGTITLQATVPPRVRPPLISSTNAS
jgi:prepilin-type N-terminal cleavage/methylation domain-containing protein